MSRTKQLALATLVAFAVVGCGKDSAPEGSSTSSRWLEAIRESGELRMVTRNAPTTYYLNRESQATGAEYDLAKAYANSLGVELRITVEDTVSGVLTALAQGKGDIAAAGLTITEQRQGKFLFTQPIEMISEQVVCRRGGNVAKRVDQLVNVSLEVSTGSSYEDTLQALQQSMPNLTWTSNENTATEPLLQKVWEAKLDCTVADENIVAFNRRFMPELIVMFDLGEPKPHAWAMPEGASSLKASLDKWLSSDAGKAAFASVHDRHYGFIDNFDYVDTRALLKRIDERLPKYDKLFDKAADQYAIDEALLAAQAYQESHWDAQAKSPTGVRGIMMLTQNTAQSLGVKDRLNPKEAIPAGAGYLAKMRERFDESIPEPDRTYMALAAYNIGRAHMHDAQTLARKLGKDPQNWADIREVLPLLSDKNYYKDLKYGYARGVEPVRYVQRIRNYQDIIDEKSE